MPAEHPVQGLLQLIRLPNLFTAAADSMAGYLIALAILQSTPGGLSVDAMAAGEIIHLVLVAVVSALVYCGGVVLNDVFDRHRDAQQRAERPIPSGRVSVQTAWTLALASLTVAGLLGVFAARRSGAAPLVTLAVLIACVVAYNRGVKCTPVGPVLMGACRGLNFTWGLAAAAGTISWTLAPAAVGLAVYVAGITWFARTEAVRSSRAVLAGACCTMLVGVAVMTAAGASWPVAQGGSLRWYGLMGLFALWLTARCLWAMADPQPGRVQVVVTQAIFSLVIFDAALVFAAAGLGPAIYVIILLPPVVLTGRWLAAT